MKMSKLHSSSASPVVVPVPVAGRAVVWRATMLTVALVSGCKGGTTVKDNPETLERLKSCSDKLGDKDKALAALEADLARMKLEAGGGGNEFVVTIQGDALEIKARPSGGGSGVSSSLELARLTGSGRRAGGGGTRLTVARSGLSARAGGRADGVAAAGGAGGAGSGWAMGGAGKRAAAGRIGGSMVVSRGGGGAAGAASGGGPAGGPAIGGGAVVVRSRWRSSANSWPSSGASSSADRQTAAACDARPCSA